MVPQPPPLARNTTPANSERNATHGNKDYNKVMELDLAESSTSVLASSEQAPCTADSEESKQGRGCCSAGGFQEQFNSGFRSSSPPDDKKSEVMRITQIYTDWANHYLEKSRYARFINDLQTDVCDGVLLADIITAVTNEKVKDIRSKPHSTSEMLENVDYCLSALKKIGVDTSEIAAKDIREGNLRSILGLFYNLSRFKQQSKGERPVEIVQKSIVTSTRQQPASCTETTGNNNETVAKDEKNLKRSNSAVHSSGIPSLLQRRASERLPAEKVSGNLLNKKNNNLNTSASVTPGVQSQPRLRPPGYSRNSSRSTSPTSSSTGGSGIPPPSRLAPRTPLPVRPTRTAIGGERTSSVGPGATKTPTHSGTVPGRSLSTPSSSSSSNVAVRSIGGPYQRAGLATPARAGSQLTTSVTSAIQRQQQVHSNSVTNNGNIKSPQSATPVNLRASRSLSATTPPGDNNNSGAMLEKFKLFRAEKNGKNGSSSGSTLPATTGKVASNVPIDGPPGQNMPIRQKRSNTSVSRSSSRGNSASTPRAGTTGQMYDMSLTNTSNLGQHNPMYATSNYKSPAYAYHHPVQQTMENNTAQQHYRNPQQFYQRQPSSTAQYFPNQTDNPPRSENAPTSHNQTATTTPRVTESSTKATHYLSSRHSGHRSVSNHMRSSNYSSGQQLRPPTQQRSQSSGHNTASSSSSGYQTVSSSIPRPGTASDSSRRRPHGDRTNSTSSTINQTSSTQDSNLDNPPEIRPIGGEPNGSSRRHYRHMESSRDSGISSSSCSKDSCTSPADAKLPATTVIPMTIPAPPPRSSSKIKLYASVPYPDGISAPLNSASKVHPPSASQVKSDLKSDSENFTPSGQISRSSKMSSSRTSSSGTRHDRQRAKELFAAVKQREESRGKAAVTPTTENKELVTGDSREVTPERTFDNAASKSNTPDRGVPSTLPKLSEKQNGKKENLSQCSSLAQTPTNAEVIQEPPPLPAKKEASPESSGLKPMTPLMRDKPYKYLKLLSSASKAYNQVASQSSRLEINNRLFLQSDPETLLMMAASEGAGDSGQSQTTTPLSENCPSDVDPFEVGGAGGAGYMSDGGDALRNSGYLSDNSGYMSEGGISMYAKKMQQRFREGMQAVQESLNKSNVMDLDNSFDEDDLDGIDDDCASIDSADLSDAVAELSNTQLQSQATTKPPSMSRPQATGTSTAPSTSRGHSVPRPQTDAPTMGYMSDMESNKLENNFNNSMRRYASDVEGDYDFDITSSCSMDLLSGKKGSEYYFSDTESFSVPRGSVRPMFNGSLNYRKGEAAPHPEHSAAEYLRMINANGFIPRHGVRRPGSSGAEIANKESGMPFQMPRMSLRLSQGSESNNLNVIRLGAGQASATEDLLETTHSRSLSMPPAGQLAMRIQLPSPQRDMPCTGPLSVSCNNPPPASPILTGGLGHIKLPYAIPSAGCGVRTSESNTSLSKELIDDMEGTKGSRLSLVSTGSCRSLNEERQAHEIRKLRRELEHAQQKVTTLSAQLTTNVHVVSAFEQSLSSMTARLHSLTSTAVEKDSELLELKNTIDSLRSQSNAAFAGLRNASISPGDIDPKSCSIQPAESMTSLASSGSVSSQDCSKKGIKAKKSGWLRQSLGKAFKKRGPKGSLGEAESDTYASPSFLGIQESVSSGAIHSDSDDMEVLRLELEEKNRRLTDVQLDALSSAHQLESLRDLMGKMRHEMTTLKHDNERLHRIARISSTSSAGEPDTSNDGLLQVDSGRLKSLTSSETGSVVDGVSGAVEFDLIFGPPVIEGGRRVTVSVHLDNVLPSSINSTMGSTGPLSNRASHILEVDIGCVNLSQDTKWDVLDTAIRRLLREYVKKVDPSANLGLNGDSIHSYYVGEVVRSKEDMNPLERLPYLFLTADEDKIRVTLKSTSQEGSADGLAFAALIPKTVLQRYMSLLFEHRRIILCGPSGTGKTYLANRLAEYLVQKCERKMNGAITTFNVDHKSSKELRTYLSSLSEQIESNHGSEQLPTVIILDNLHHVTSLAEIFNNFLSVKNQKSPFIIGTMNQATCSTANLQLHHNFRWVLCANHIEPVKGFLGRFLRRKLIQFEVESRAPNPDLRNIVEWIPSVWQHLNRFLETHSSSDVTIGPRLFLSCPMTIEGSKVWFTDLWNYSLVPYLLEAIREGLQQYGRRAAWEDPIDWILTTWPWNSPPGQDWTSLMRLRPEDVGYDPHLPLSASVVGGKRSVDSMLTSSATVSGDQGGDPLMNMLMRLQEVSGYSGAQTDSDSSSSLGRHGTTSKEFASTQMY